MAETIAPAKATGAQPQLIRGHTINEPTMPTFADDLKAWIKRTGHTRNTAAEALCVPRSTIDGWCAGRSPGLEGAIRKLMALIEAG